MNSKDKNIFNRIKLKRTDSKWMQRALFLLFKLTKWAWLWTKTRRLCSSFRLRSRCSTCSSLRACSFTCAAIPKRALSSRRPWLLRWRAFAAKPSKTSPPMTRISPKLARAWLRHRNSISANQGFELSFKPEERRKLTFCWTFVCWTWWKCCKYVYVVWSRHRFRFYWFFVYILI